LLFCSHEFAQQAFLEWKAGRRDELSEYQKQIGDQQLSYVEKELERWQNAGERAMM
jgi:pinin